MKHKTMYKNEINKYVVGKRSFKNGNKIGTKNDYDLRVNQKYKAVSVLMHNSDSRKIFITGEPTFAKFL